jgi:hypothetical protein
MANSFVAYLRVSTEKQGVAGNGIDAQSDSAARYAADTGDALRSLPPDEVESAAKHNLGGDVKKYGDKCVSGEMQPMMDLELLEISRKHGMTAEADYTRPSSPKRIRPSCVIMSAKSWLAQGWLVRLHISEVARGPNVDHPSGSLP